MSKIINVVPKDGYVLGISFSDGSVLDFCMKRQVKTAQFHEIKEPEAFKKVYFDDKSIFWQPGNSKQLCMTLDSILFTLRDVP